MNLKELKKMIAEEYSNYLEQEEVSVDVQPDVDVDMDTDPMGSMGDEGDKDSEETLRTIFDMLSNYFDDEGEDMDDEEMPMDDVEGEEAPEADLEEFYPSKAATTTKSGEYGAAGFKKAATTKGSTGFGDSNSLNEGIERMQKLANIIK